MIYLSKATLSLELAPLSFDKVAGLHRASPSASLDRDYLIDIDYRMRDPTLSILFVNLFYRHA